MSMTVQRWDTVELSFRGKGEYSNPFTDVALTGTFQHEASGQAITVDGFHDGDDVWRIRLMPLELGLWRWQTHSDDPGLGDQNGEIECVAPVDAYLRGPLGADGFHFRHADGSYRYLISTRVTCQFADPEVWHRLGAFAVEHRINRVFFIMGGRHGTIGTLYGNTPDACDYDRYSLGKFRSIDAFIDTLRRYDVLAGPYFYYFNDGAQNPMTLEQDRAYIRYGMARFGAYCNVLPCLANQVEGKYTKGGPHGVPYDDRNYEWGNEIGAYLKSKAVFGTAVTVHNPLENQGEKAVNPSFYTILRDWQFPWADYMMRQMQIGAIGGVAEFRDDVPEQNLAGGVPGPNNTMFPRFYNPRAFANQNSLLTELRRFGVPVINEEPGYEMKGINGADGTMIPKTWNSMTSEAFLSTLWSAVCAGAYSMWGNLETYCMDDPLPGIENSVVPQYLRVAHDLLTSLPFWELEPANEVVAENGVWVDGQEWRTVFACGKSAERYLVFSEYGMGTELTLPEGEYRPTRINPRRGTRVELPALSGGAGTIELPRGEWLLLIERI